MTEAIIITATIVGGVNLAFATLLHFAYKLRRDQFDEARAPLQGR